MDKPLIHNMEDKYQEYLSDESKWEGQASSISFPENEAEILQVIQEMQSRGIPVTIQGGKTGLVAGAAPARGHVLNLSRMNKIKGPISDENGVPLLRVEPGVTLYELDRWLRRTDYPTTLFWPPDPTETMATIGGIAACGAKGSRAYLYGETKTYIHAIRVIDANGDLKTISRGERFIRYYDQEIDLVDFYLGSEGLYGVISEITLRLIEKPGEMWAIAFFFQDKSNSYTFARLLREDKSTNHLEASIAAIEYFDRTAIELISAHKTDLPSLKELPEVEPDTDAMIYVEIHGQSEEAIESIAENLVETFEKCQGDAEQTWAFVGESEVEKIRKYRHAAPELVNQFIEKAHKKEKEITKLGFNLPLSTESIESRVTSCENDILQAGLKACIFGHIGSDHLHVNLLPENMNDYQKGYQLIRKWGKDYFSKKEMIGAEHGIGKLKKEIFLENAPDDYVDAIRGLKNKVDPKHLWNPGNVLDE